MPVERGALRHRDPGLVVLVVEQAQLDAAGVLGEQREVGAAAVPGRAQRERAPGPYPVFAQAISAPDIGSSSTWPSTIAGSAAVVASTTDSARARHAARLGARSSSRARTLPRRTRSHRASSSNSIASTSPGGSRRRVFKQIGVQARQRRVAPAGQLRALERRAVLRVGNLLVGERRERRELRSPSLARGLRDVLVDVVREELKRRVLAVLLAHEQHRDVRREQRAERGQRARFGGQPIAEGAIPDLVVVLVEDHEPLGRHVVGGRTEPPAAERRVRAVVDERAVPSTWRDRATEPKSA